VSTKLLEALTDDIATAAVAKKGNPMLAQIITLFFFVSVNDGSYFNSPSLLHSRRYLQYCPLAI
jgi:hypothetical protein